MRILEALDELEPLGQFLADLFALGGSHRFLELFVELVEIDLREKFFHRFRAHAGHEIVAVLLLRFTIFHFIEELRLLQRRLARIDDDVILVIDDALELARAHVEHEAEARWHTFVEPYVRNRHGQFNMTHAFAANAGERYFHAATIANDALMFDALVFSAGAFPIPCRTKNSLAEKAALFRLKGAVINCLRVFDFALAPGSHRVARRDADRHLLKTHGALFAHQLTPGVFVHDSLQMMVLNYATLSKTLLGA